MAPQYDDAVFTLYRGPLDTFVAERKRLAAEIKAGGDKASAARLDKLARPTMSAWVVNQLWWGDRADFDVLLSSAARLRQGDMAAMASHREATGKLRERAATILTAAGHGATEATLRRVTSTLHALAASGGFAPDPDGALSGDRDPPGFEAAGFGAAVPPAASAHAVTTKTKHETKTKGETGARSKTDAKTDAKVAAEAKARDAAAEKADRERAAAARAKEKVEREKRDAGRRAVQLDLRTARTEVATATSEITRLRDALATAEERRTRAEAKRDALDAQLAALIESNSED